LLINFEMFDLKVYSILTSKNQKEVVDTNLASTGDGKLSWEQTAGGGGGSKGGVVQ
jgi:hypothetical protein